jgi:hypothetical protein
MMKPETGTFGTYGPSPGPSADPPPGPAPVLVIDDEPAAATTTRDQLAAGCDGVLHEPASADAFVREVHRLEGAEPCRPGAGTDHIGSRS